MWYTLVFGVALMPQVLCSRCSKLSERHCWKQILECFSYPGSVKMCPIPPGSELWVELSLPPPPELDVSYH